MLKALDELRSDAKKSGVKIAIKNMFKKYGWK